MSINIKQYAFNIIIIMVVFILLKIVNDTLLLNYGDNALYLDAYNKYVNNDILTSYYYYRTITGGQEYIYFYLSYIASVYISYNQYILIQDILFLYLLY